MRRFIFVLLALAWASSASAQQEILRSSPTYVGTATSLVLTIEAWDEYNVTLTANTPIKFSVPTLSNSTVRFRVNTCQDAIGGWTPTFSVVGSATIVSRVGASVTTTTANSCDTEFWSYRNQTNQLVLESVSFNNPSTVGGTFPLTGNVSAANNKIQNLGAATANGDAVGYGQSSAAFKSTNNNIQYADQFTGATWAQQINAAVAALPSTGGTVDAQGLCLGSLTTATSKVTLGTDTKPIKLLLGACTYPLGANSIEYFPGTTVIGAGIHSSVNNGTLITFTGGGSGFVYGTAGALQTTGVYGVHLSDFHIQGDGTTSGSIGIDGTYLLQSTIERVRTDNVDTGWKLGGTGTCSCYNQLIKVFGSGRIRGGWISTTAHQNQIIGGGGSTVSTGTALDITAGFSNQIYSFDVEGAALYAIHLGPVTGNAIVNPYLEATGPITIDSGATTNSIYGSGGLFQSGTVVDNSGNKTNYLHQTGGGGGTDGVWPYYESVQNGLIYGTGGPGGNNIGIILNGDSTGQGGFDFISGRLAQAGYGHYGHVSITAGEVLPLSGLATKGAVSTAAIATPPAPTISVVGTTGTTSYGPYFVVCRDQNNGVTLPSAASNTVTNGPAVLSSSNYISIQQTVAGTDGCYKWDILKGNTSTALTTNLFPAPNACSGSPQNCTSWAFNDTGQATSAYTAPTRNTTSDVSVAGMATVNALNLQPVLTTITGTTSGSAKCAQTVIGTDVSVACHLTAYDNDTTTAQTYTFPTAFTNTPSFTANTGPIPATATTTTLTLPKSMAGAAQTSLIKIEELQ